MCVCVCVCVCVCQLNYACKVHVCIIYLAMGYFTIDWVTAQTLVSLHHFVQRCAGDDSQEPPRGFSSIIFKVAGLIS